VTLVPVEALRLGLAAVTHLLVFDGDPAVLGDALADAQPAARSSSDNSTAVASDAPA
jgi:hypothetical protein